MRHAARILMVTIVIGVTVTACGGDSKTVETKDGKITVDENGKDGKVTIEGENGGTATFGTQKVPADFPSEVPLPKGLKLQSAISSQQDGKQYFQLVYSLAKSNPEDAIADYRGRIDSDGFTIEESGTFGAGGASLSGFEATKGDWTVVASGIGGDQTGSVLSISVTKG